MAGCIPIIAIELHRSRLALAGELGATHVLNAAAGNLPHAVSQLANGGAEYVIEATSAPSASPTPPGPAAAAAVWCCSAPAAPVTLKLGDLQAGTIRTVIEGESVPDRFIPELIARRRQRRFVFDRLITYYDFKDINRVAHDSETGQTIKAVLRLKTRGAGGLAPVRA